MERDTMVNYMSDDSDRRIPRDVEVFDPATLDHAFSEAIDMNKPEDDHILENNDLETDLNVNYAMDERGINRIPSDVEIFNPDMLATRSSDEYVKPRVHSVEIVEGPCNDLESDLRVNELLENSSVRVPRDVEVFDPADL